MKSKFIQEVKEEVLSNNYEVSFAFVDKKEIKKLNKEYRKKDEPTDVLSFSLSKNSGEILICKEIAKIKAKNLEQTLEKYLHFLIIHAMLHLKGLDHGDKMERAEKKLISKFNL